MERLFSNIQQATEELRSFAEHFREVGISAAHDKLIRIANQIDTSAEEIQHFSELNKRLENWETPDGKKERPINNQQ